MSSSIFYFFTLLIGLFAMIYFKYSAVQRNCKMNSNIEPAAGWDLVSQTFNNFLQNGEIQGSSFSVYYKGKKTVDIMGGYTDINTLSEWQHDTLSIIYSITKSLTSVCLLHLYDKGLVGLDDKITKYWPEYGQNGKEETTITHLLSHLSCMAVIDVDYDTKLLINDDISEIEKIYVNQKPTCEIGKNVSYHALTYGTLIDILIRKIDKKHRSLSVYFHEEIAKPNNLDIFIGLPYSENYRVTHVEPLPMVNMELFFKGQQYLPFIFNLLFYPNSISSKSISKPSKLNKENAINNPYVRRIPDGSFNGYSNAANLAKFYSLIDSGKILKLKTSQRLIEPIAEHLSKFNLGTRTLTTMSYGMLIIDLFGHKMYGHPGAGGQAAFTDPKNKLSVSYITNFPTIFGFGDDPRYYELLKTVYKCANISDIEII